MTEAEIELRVGRILRGVQKDRPRRGMRGAVAILSGVGLLCASGALSAHHDAPNHQLDFRPNQASNGVHSWWVRRCKKLSKSKD